jgi:hypothetical protein
MTAVPLTTHLFLVALPLAILAASLAYFFVSGRRRER